MQPYSVAVVLFVSEAAAGSFDVFDQSVGAFGGGVGDTEAEEGFLTWLTGSGLPGRRVAGLGRRVVLGVVARPASSVVTRSG